jgi:hypothetical protein
MNSFINTKPSLDAYWRGIILFGRNVATYKFALAKSLLDVATDGRDFVQMHELAVPFSKHLAEHIGHVEKQGTFSTSKFLDACKRFSDKEISSDEIVKETVRLGFNNVIDAFHIVNQAEVPSRFFVDDRKGKNGITLTDNMFNLKADFQSQNLPLEVEARWRLVETAWSLGLAPNLISVGYDGADQSIFTNDSKNRRTSVTSCRDALNGYQKGTCFYCFDEISIAPLSSKMADIDHFFPFCLVDHSLPPKFNIDGIWNLVLACTDCNKGVAGKFAQVPKIRYLERLHRRNSHLVDSHHPLRETLINQTGKSETDRRTYLQECDSYAITHLLHRWAPKDERESAF